MKPAQRILPLFILLIFLIPPLSSTLPVTAEAQELPFMIPHTGTVMVDGAPFTGQGQFKLAIVNADGSTHYWSNDGSYDPDTGPENHLLVDVVDGVFLIKLGDPLPTNRPVEIPMPPLDPDVFDEPETYLRIWFNDGAAGFQRLSPDRQLLSVPYAYRADSAQRLTGDQVIASTQILDEAVTREKIAEAAVGIEQIADGAVGGAQVDPQQVQRRIWESCPAGRGVLAVNEDGSVLCDSPPPAERYLSINLYGGNLSDSSARFQAGNPDTAGVLFPDSSTSGLPTLDYSFVLPEDYAAGTAVVVEVLWMSPGTTGEVDLRHFWGMVYRPDSTPSALLPLNPPPTVLDGGQPRRIHKAEFPLQAGQPLAPGDAVTHGIMRNVGDSSTDPVYIGGLRVRYTAQK